MRLIRHGLKGEERPGIELNGERYDCSNHFEDYNRDFFQNDGLSKLQKLISESGDKLEKIDESVRWGSPVARPGMIMCVGLNYSDHAIEAGMEIPTEPILFMKATNTLSGPFDDVPLPKDSIKTDWEVELGVVIGEDATYLEDKAAGEKAIAGYCVINDLSERAFQLERGGQWVKGKSCPGFSPVGPYLITKDEIADVLDLTMTLSVNDQLMQDGSSKTMIFDPAFVVHYISQYMTLEAGDIISTGTPPGVGLGMTPPLYLKKGDKMSLEISGLGKQGQTII